jgi:hypothetical protein
MAKWAEFPLVWQQADAILGPAMRTGCAPDGTKGMTEKLPGEYRTWGLRLVSLLVIVSFTFIPVRCDASAAPHSIFVAPNMLNQSGEHAHHATETSHHAVAKSVPHHSPVAADTAGHTHNAASDDASSSLSDSSQQACAVTLAAGSDPESQQPVGATLDLPATSLNPDTATLQPLDMETELLLFAPAAVLTGMAAPPDAPPPKAS